jgi:hypothetical protein
MLVDVEMLIISMIDIETWLPVGIPLVSLTELEIKVFTVWSVDILFPVSDNVGGCREGDYLHGRHQNHTVSRWNFVFISYRTADIDTSGFAASILDFQISVARDSVAMSLDELADSENGARCWNSASILRRS